jgi:hypothetical protein
MPGIICWLVLKSHSQFLHVPVSRVSESRLWQQDSQTDLLCPRQPGGPGPASASLSQCDSKAEAPGRNMKLEIEGTWRVGSMPPSPNQACRRTRNQLVTWLSEVRVLCKKTMHIWKADPLDNSACFRISQTEWDFIDMPEIWPCAGYPTDNSIPGIFSGYLW